MAASGTKLMEEIYDQFLICKICFEPYKRPKTLSCLHTFCEPCLQKHQDAEIERSYRYMLYSRAVSCPICRKKTEMPSGGIKRLPDNFLVSNLNAVINRRKPVVDSPICEICQSPENDPGKRATCKCLECSKLLCKACVELHRRTKVTLNHTLFDIEVEKDIECKIHKDEVVRFYCELCDMCICVVCTFQEHKGHEVSSFTEGMQKYRTSLDSLVGECREKIAHVKEHIDLIAKCEADVKKAEDQIRDTTIDTIAAIRKKEKDMMEKLYTVYGTETFEYFKEKEPLQEDLENLQSTCNLTDIITRDQNIELLLLKRDIQEKLKLLLQRKLLSPPDAIGRQVRFTPGHLVFGSLVTDEVPRLDEACDDIDFPPATEHVEGKCNVMDMDIQTNAMMTSDQWTSMGQFVLNYNNEQLTQTEKIPYASRGCSPFAVSLANQCTMTTSPDVKQQWTMTTGTPMMKRKIQTDSVTHLDEESIATREIATSHMCTNTPVVNTSEQNTATKRQKVSDQVTDTSGLLQQCHKETVTLPLESKHCATLTDAVSALNKSTLTARLEQADKITCTARLIQNTQSTMTPTVRMLDMGVDCRVLGENKAVGTTTIVTTHTSVGKFDVRTSEQSEGTPWASWSDPSNMHDQDTYTDAINMVDKVTCTTRIYTSTVGTITQSSKPCHKGIGTVQIDMSHQSVEADFGYLRPVMSTECSQTLLSFQHDIIMPNLTPCNKSLSTDHVEYKERGTATPKLKRKNKHVLTDSVQMKDSSFGTGSVDMYTETMQDVGNSLLLKEIKTRDNGNDAHQGIVHEVYINTDLEYCPTPGVGTGMDIVFPNGEPPVVAQGVDRGTTMQSGVETVDAYCAVQPVMADMACNTIAEPKPPLPQPVSLSDNSTLTDTMDVACVGTGTEHINTSEAGTGTLAVEQVTTGNDPVRLLGIDQSTGTVNAEPEPVKLSDNSTLTDTMDMVFIGTGTEYINTSEAGTAMIPVEQVTAGNDPVFLGIDQSTGTVHTELADIGVGTAAISTSAKETFTDVIQMRDAESATCVPTTERATHMPWLETASTGTCTQDDVLSHKTRGTMTKKKKMATVETSMMKGVHACDTAVSTDRVVLVHTAVGPPKIEIRNAGTGMPQIVFCENSTSTVPVQANSASTTTFHSVFTSDGATGMPAITTCDASATADILKPYVGKTTCTMTSPVETADVGVLKRPHTVSRGTEPTKLRRVSRGTATAISATQNTSSMTQPMETEDKGITVMTIEQASKGTATPQQKLVDSSTHMRQVVLMDRESSPIRNRLVDRASSPIPMDTCDRESSPVRFIGIDKGVGVRADTKERYTSTAHVKFRTRGTMYEPTLLVNREVSPIPELQPSPPVTAEKATCMPVVSYTDREVSPVRGITRERGTSTTVVEMVDRESTPIRTVTKTRGVSAIAKMATKGVCTPHVSKKETSTEMKVITMTETSTTMPRVSYLEKETSTPHVHIMHKNVSTENIMTAEKQTSTIDTDVTAAYREVTQEAQPVTVSRGTCTPSVSMATKETSPPRFCSLNDRASSPFHPVRMVDKGVSAKSGEIIEPQDKFQRVGSQKVVLKPIAEGPRPTLASIQEDSAEFLSSDDDCGTPLGCGTSLGCSPLEKATVTSPPVSTANVSFLAPVTHREKFQSSVPRLGRPFQSTFNSGGHGSASSIVWKVEMATNTPEVTMQSTGTSTPPVAEKEDKAICTESVTMGGKMADCINKLKNVRQRLEQQPLYTQASSQTAPARESTKPSTAPALAQTLSPLALQMRSKSVEERLNERGVLTSPMTSPLLARAPASSTESFMTASDGSDHEASQHSPSNSRRLGLARRQRLDISQLLRSSSVPENAYERPKIQLQTVHTQVIPKLGDIKGNDRLRKEGKPPTEAPVAGTRPKRTKHRAKPRETQNLQDAILELRRNSDGGDSVRSRQDRQKDRFEKLAPQRRLPALPQSARSEIATTGGARASPRVRRKTIAAIPESVTPEQEKK